MNFNTFANSLIFFFVVSLNNDWPILANLAIANEPSERKLMKLIFTFFKLVVNYILLNSIIAFVIEILYDYEKKLSKNKI